MSTVALSPCGKYRYRLTRGAGKLMPVVMLNPSTADAVVDDPTIRRLLGFAVRGVRFYTGHIQHGSRFYLSEKFDGVDVVNLYGLRATNPAALKAEPSPYGPDNDAHLGAFCDHYAGRPIIVAWGTHAKSEAVKRFMRHAGSSRLWCFGLTQAGHPRHPLYLPYARPLEPYAERRA